MINSLRYKKYLPSKPTKHKNKIKPITSYSRNSAESILELIQISIINLEDPFKDEDSFKNRIHKLRENFFNLGERILSKWTPELENILEITFDDLLILADYKLRTSDLEQLEKIELEQCIEYCKDVKSILYFLRGARGAYLEGREDFFKKYIEEIKNKESKYITILS